MNPAEALLRETFGAAGGAALGEDARKAREARYHPDVRYDLFGPTGTRETHQGREAVFAFMARAGAALDGHSDEVLDIRGIDEDCAMVHARAWRRSKATGEELTYEWAMLYRVKDGQILYGADMLSEAAQAFWGRIEG